MIPDKDSASAQNNPGNSASEENKNTQALPVHNPLKKEDDKEITQQDVENEQTFKEAQTERD